MIAVLAAILALGASDPKDPLFSALEDELGRSMTRLELAPAGRPYYVDYTVRETSQYDVSASFGALTGQNESRHRHLFVDARVGDYALDNTNFVDEGQGGGEQSASITVDDDYQALRAALWLATDRAYKHAIEQREKKLAFLQTTEVKDRPDDFSREPAVLDIRPVQPLKVDRERAASEVRRLSNVFRRYPRVLVSSVSFRMSASNRWYVNSEGTRVRVGKEEARVLAVAGAQAKDGMRLVDYEIVNADLQAGKDTAEKAIRALAERLTKLADAPLAGKYRGPIVFEDQASADFFLSTVAWNVTAPREQLGSRGVRASRYPMREELGRRVMPRFMTVIDDPSVTEFGGAPVLGGYEIDDDGVRAQRVTLIERGVLKTFCMSRAPTREFKKSNGHSRYGWGMFGTIFVSTEHPSPAVDLRRALAEIGKREELDYVYVVKKLSTLTPYTLAPWAGSWARQAQPRKAGEIYLPAPMLLYRVSMRDGTETMVRGAVFGSLSLRVLRDIRATGDDVRPRPVLYSDEIHSIVSPSVLVEEVELEEANEELEKPPLTPHPYFEPKRG